MPVKDYPVGQGIRIATPEPITDADGVPLDPATVTLMVQKPDSTVQNFPAPAQVGVGLYHQDLAGADIAQLGPYQYVWVTTSPNGVSFTGGFNVIELFSPPGAPLLPMVTTADLAVYLGFQTIDKTRAQMLIDDAVTQALEVVTVGDVPADGPTEANLPPGAAGIIRAAVARIYLSIATDVSQDPFGVASTGRTVNTGAMFSAAEVIELRRAAGRTGAFMVDLMPAGAGSNLPPWDLDGSGSSFDRVPL
jgi:hypothetical protein